MDHPKLKALFAPFHKNGRLLDCTEITAEEIPQPYRSFLVQNKHMTFILESVSGKNLRLKVLRFYQDQKTYTRMSLLLIDGGEGKGETTVGFGIISCLLEAYTKKMKENIIAGKIPLGTMFKENKAKTRVEYNRFYKIKSNDFLEKIFRTDKPAIVYARQASIYISGNLGVEVFEVLAP